MLSCTLRMLLHSVYLCLTVRHKQVGPTLGVSGGLCAVRQYLCINNKMAMSDILCDTLKISKYDVHAHNKYFLKHFYCIHWECRLHYWGSVSLCHSFLKSQRQTNAPWILLILKACLHIPIPSPTPSPSSFIIVSVVTKCLTGTMGVEPTFGMCKQAFRSRYSKNCEKKNRFPDVACIPYDGGFTFKSTLAGPSGKNR